MKTAYKPVVKLAAAAAAAFFAVSSIQVPVTALAYTKPAGSHVLTPIASGVTTYSNESYPGRIQCVGGLYYGKVHGKRGQD